MKNQVLILAFAICCLFISHEALAQIPQSINYQAVARDGSGALLANQLLGSG